MNGCLRLPGSLLLVGLPLIASAGAEEPTSAAQQRQTVTVRRFGAVGDGAADDAAAIQRAVDAGVGEIRLPRGVYRIGRPVVIDLDKVGPTSLAGGGTARILMTGPGPALKFVGTHEGTAAPGTVKPNVWQRQRMPTVDALEIIGAHQQAVGIEASGTMQLVLSRVNIRRVLHGIHLTGRNRNVIVSDCHLYENRGVGLYLDDVNLHQINVTGCHISYNAAGGVVVRSGNVRNLQLTGCDVEGNMAADGPPTANVLIDGRGGEAGIAEVAITGCTIQHTRDAPDSANIRFVGLDRKDRRWGHLTIANNVLSDVQINVDIQRARGVSIVGNTFWKGVQHNLRVQQSSNVVIGPNVMDRNPRYQRQQDANEGAVLRDCQDCTISGLHINGVRRAKAGLILENCRRLNVSGCTILDCEKAGVLLKDVSHSRLSGCLIRNDAPDADSWQPVIASGGSGNMITGNLLDGQIRADTNAHHIGGNISEP
ncbi:MAG: right-handed parallel beta-helix repeat-containing protein [Planctomycetota bacterium]|jgi:hypothetical protein